MLGVVGAAFHRGRVVRLWCQVPAASMGQCIPFPGPGITSAHLSFSWIMPTSSALPSFSCQPPILPQPTAAQLVWLCLWSLEPGACRLLGEARPAAGIWQCGALLGNPAAPHLELKVFQAAEGEDTHPPELGCPQPPAPPLPHCHNHTTTTATVASGLPGM